MPSSWWAVWKLAFENRRMDVFFSGKHRFTWSKDAYRVWLYRASSDLSHPPRSSLNVLSVATTIARFSLADLAMHFARNLK